MLKTNDGSPCTGLYLAVDVPNTHPLLRKQINTGSAVDAYRTDG